MDVEERAASRPFPFLQPKRSVVCLRLPIKRVKRADDRVDERRVEKRPASAEAVERLGCQTHGPQGPRLLSEADERMIPLQEFSGVTLADAVVAHGLDLEPRHDRLDDADVAAGERAIDVKD